MKKIIISILIFIMSFAGVLSPAIPVLANASLSMGDEVTTIIEPLQLVPDFVEDKYYITFPLKELGIVHLEQYNFDFTEPLKIKSRWGAKNWQQVNCNIEIQFYADNPENNFIFVVETAINCCTWALNHSNVVELYFSDNYEFVFNDKTIYDLLQKESPDYRIVLRGENWHFRTKKQSSTAGQNIGIFWGDWATYEPNYKINDTATTSNPINICGEVWKPSDPENNGDVIVVEPEQDNILLRVVTYLKNGFLKNATTFNKVISWGVAVLGVMIILTVLAFFFKWFKFIFGK